MSETVLKNSNELPSSWSTIILQDYVNIAARIGWRGLKKSEYTNSGAFLLAVKDIEDDGTINFSGIQDHLSDFRYNESPEIQLKEKDILITKDGTIGKIGFITKLPKKTTVNSSILVVRPLNFVYPRYLFYYFKSPFFQKIVKEKVKGTAVPHLFQYDIKNFKIHVAPLNEQKRIVAKIEELFSKLDFAKQTLEKTKTLLKQYRQSLLKHAFEGKLTEKWREENNDKLEPASVLLEKIRHEKGLKKTDLSMSELILEKKLPKNWVISDLENILSKLETGSRPKGGVSAIKQGIPSIGGEHLDYNGGFNLENVRFIPEKFYEDMPKGHIQINDILIVKDGATTGKISFVNQAFPFKKSAVNEHVFILRGIGSIIFQQYLFRYLFSSVGQRIIKSRITGSAQGGINTSFIKNFPIPIPPLNEQKRIVAKIEEGFSLIENNEKIIDLSLKNIEGLRKSILKQAFEGKLVPQDPNDEPAELLLEKIRQEKQKIINSKPRRKKNDK